MYNGEDPEAPNYDPVNKVIKSIWNGSKGPMMHKATTYDWVGDPVPGAFHLLHNPAGRGKLLDLEANYKKMLAHCEEYLDSVGDNPLNLASTILDSMPTCSRVKKISQLGSRLRRRMEAAHPETGGNIPTNVGLDGKPGGEVQRPMVERHVWMELHHFRWRTGTDRAPQQFHQRRLAWFGNAFLLSGDPSFIQVLRRQMDNMYAQKKVENGRTLLPSGYGDPRGYKYSGQGGW